MLGLHRSHTLAENALLVGSVVRVQTECPNPRGYKAGTRTHIEGLCRVCDHYQFLNFQGWTLLLKSSRALQHGIEPSGFMLYIYLLTYSHQGRRHRIVLCAELYLTYWPHTPICVHESRYCWWYMTRGRIVQVSGTVHCITYSDVICWSYGVITQGPWLDPGTVFQVEA